MSGSASNPVVDFINLLQDNGIRPFHVGPHWEERQGVFLVFFAVENDADRASVLDMARAMLDLPEVALVEDRGRRPIYLVTLRGADYSAEQLAQWRAASLAALDRQRTVWLPDSEEPAEPEVPAEVTQQVACRVLPPAQSKRGRSHG